MSFNKNIMKIKFFNKLLKLLLEKKICSLKSIKKKTNCVNFNFQS